MITLSLRIITYTALLSLILSHLIPYKTINPEMAPYEQEYLHYVVKYCRPDQYLSNPLQKSFEIAPLANYAIARCISNGYTNMYITYNSKYWKMDSHDARLSTMFHELTHCYFNERHSGDPKHFMYSDENYLSAETVQVQLEEYLKKKCGK